MVWNRQNAGLVSTLALSLALMSCAQENTQTAPPAEAPVPVTETDTPAPQAASFQPNTQAVTDLLESAVAEERIAGGIVVIHQNGEEIYSRVVGMADREAETPMSREDTLFQIYSMSKPVTGVALMTLYEDGKFQLDDPLSKYIPGFEDMQVFEGLDENGEPILVPAEREITILDVLTHTAGFGYRVYAEPAEDDYLNGLYWTVYPLSDDKTLEQMASEVADLPLYFQPGTQWQYSLAVDMQARLVEVLSGQSFHDYLQASVLTPLGMDGTSRFLTQTEIDQLAAGYSAAPEGGLVRMEDDMFYAYNNKEHPLEMGGAGLVMPIDDYVAFAQMLANGGSYKGVEILKPETVELMATDHLDWPMDYVNTLGNEEDLGFGIDFAVRRKLAQSAEGLSGPLGEFYWDGFASTFFWVDPVNDMTAVMMVQKVPFDGALHKDFHDAVYAGTEYAAPTATE